MKDLVIAWLEERSGLYRVLVKASAAVAGSAYAGSSLGFDALAWVMHAGLVVVVAVLPLLAVNAIDLWDAQRCRSRIPEARVGSSTRAGAAQASELPRRARRRARLACALMGLAPLALILLTTSLAVLMFQSAIGQAHPLIDVDLRLLPLWLGGTGAFALMFARSRSIGEILSDLGADPTPPEEPADERRTSS